MFNRVSILCVCWFLGASASGHPGGDPLPTPIDKPFSADFDCSLPSSMAPVAITYHVWLAFEQPSDNQKEQNCLRFADAQKLLVDEGLHLRFFPDPGSGGLDCATLPVAAAPDSTAISAVNKLAKRIHSWEADWDELTEFIDTAKGSYFEEGSVNVYLLASDVIVDFRGMHIRDKDHRGHLIFIPEDASADTFVHEFGHAFSLNHINFMGFFKDRKKGVQQSPDGTRKEYCIEYDAWDGVCDFRESNIMWSRRNIRTEFSLGQKLRMVCNDWSSLNSHGDRPAGAPTFKCPDWAVVDLLSLEDDVKGHTHCPVLHEGIHDLTSP